MSVTCKLIKPDVRIYAQNPICQKPINVGCCYCTDKTGRKKNYKNLWKLYMHFREHHKQESNHAEIVTTLAKFVIDGVLL